MKKNYASCWLFTKTVCVIKSRIVTWKRDVTHNIHETNIHTKCFCEYLRRKSVGRPRYRRQDNIQMNSEQSVCARVKWMQMTVDLLVNCLKTETNVGSEKPGLALLPSLNFDMIRFISLD
jgi:hypothetical protein